MVAVKELSIPREAEEQYYLTIQKELAILKVRGTVNA